MLQLSITDIMGRTVLHFPEAIFDVGKHSIPINTEQLSNGVYLIQLNSKVGTFVEKLVVER
jgi:hypothetical protein